MAALRQVLRVRRERRQARDDLAVLACLLLGDETYSDIWRRIGLSSGRAYPALARLEWVGLARSAWDQPERGELPRRRHYWPTTDAVAHMIEGAKR